MNIVSEKKYSYLLMEEDNEWYLTYLTGGAFEVDICVKLNNEEINKLKETPEFVGNLVENFKTDSSLYEGRRIIPSVRPNRQRQRT
ncbi:hypothetical protein [Thalassomonas haliotis]|uniref:Uncharacterized protein n=1 Tax=Thalassomonas haliotis TaxID=485448 RepID=A0ABY7VIF5_9GAMM|nr:hypothetical protein [Thalassomonas haliotis]WDE13514.1 hypothetical protein H3N35_08790 [Thalassomonas haliotis]